MTEEEWLHTKSDLREMVGCLDDGNGVSRRKLALLAVAFCHRLWHLMSDHRSRAAVEYTQSLADDPEDLGQHWPRTLRRSAPEDACYEAPLGVLKGAAELAYEVSGFLRWGTSEPGRVLDLAELGRRTVAADRSGQSGTPDQEIAAHSGLVRDIFGNPFRPVAFAPEWRTSTAVALAQQMYEARDFSAMPILADAPQDAGCDSAEVLDHCRGAGPHVRGCWVVDMLLGKE